MPTPSSADHHVEPRGRQWAVRRSGAQQAEALFVTKREAEARAHRLAREQGGSVVVHDRDGDVETRQPA